MEWINNTRYNDIKTLDHDFNRYLKSETNFLQNLSDYIFYLKNTKKYASGTIHGHIKKIKQFLSENDVEIIYTQKFKKQLPKIENITHDVAPHSEDVKKIILSARPMMRSLLLFLISGGMRINELLSLHPEDIGERSGVGIIHLDKSITKNGKPRIVCITPECLHFYKEWMAKREEYIKQKKDNYFSNHVSENKTIFPFAYNTVRRMFDTTLKEAGFNKKHNGSNRNIIHFHLFRKYFDTMCFMSGMSDSMRYAMIGHASNKMDRIYILPGEEMLIQEYLKAVPKLTVLTDIETEKQMHFYKNKCEKIDISMDTLLSQMKEQADRIQRQDDILQEMNKTLQVYDQAIKIYQNQMNIPQKPIAAK